MSLHLGSYSFLPWLRLGIANRLQTGGSGQRTTIPVSLTLEGVPSGGSPLTQTIQRDVQLYGPGDIVGIDRRAIIKVEPGPRITNFEPNYLPHVDFYDEDLPWRYTPEAPQNNRLRPWVMLVVLKESEFEEGAATAGRPLPFIVVEGADGIFPPFAQLWAWAHVHVNRDLAASDTEIVSSDMGAVMPRFAAALQENPDLAYSRILCPRKLDVNATYHAFLLPSYESGRLAGLGLDPAGTPSRTHGAWQPDTGKSEASHYPYYYRWSFQTGATGDFEYLVRLLEPQPIDSRVGRVDVDVQEPGANLAPIDDPELEGVLRLGGALRVPLSSLDDEELATFNKYENWDQPGYPHPFQRDLAAFINLADDYQVKSAIDAHADSDFEATVPDPEQPAEIVDDPDPLITPPLYGRWHALTARLLEERDGTPRSPDDNWVHELNLDPRHRMAAAFGTAIVQSNQEAYMDAAWQQIGDVLTASRLIRLAQLGMFASERLYSNAVVPLARSRPERAYWLTAPVQRRVLRQGQTAYYEMVQSRVPPAITSGAARRILRPRARLARQLLPPGGEHTLDNLLGRISAGEVTATPDKAPLDGAPVVDDLADSVEPDDIPPWAADLLDRYPDLRRNLLIALLALLLLVPVCAILGPLLLLPLVLAAAVLAAYYQLGRWETERAPAQSVREENQRPETVDDLPQSPDFRLVEVGDSFIPTRGRSDSPEAVNFKAALKEAYTLVSATADTDDRQFRPALDLAEVTASVVAAIDPQVTIPRHTLHGVVVPPRIREQIGERFVEPMAYPEIDLPMYKPLVAKSDDYFLPNIQFVEQNSISLLETNQPFIEAYMVGLNHEFSRELLWREYPTDQRGSYFRQFWDVSGYLADSDVDPDVLRERLRDIPPLHRWSRTSNLGDHDHRETGGESEEEVVLVIRGELLKKYPNAVIYAHRARWQLKEDGTIDNAKERRLDDPGAADAAHPPRDKVKSPLYEAKVDPDITFFGFDLTVEEAQGGTGEDEGDDPGWFFVIKERPGEPRFGLDVSQADDIYVWNDLGWGNVVPNVQPGDYVQITASTPTINLDPLPADADEQTEQAADDAAVHWHKDSDAAELAYILYQVPVLVAVHAAEMLPRDE